MDGASSSIITSGQPPETSTIPQHTGRVSPLTRLRTLPKPKGRSFIPETSSSSELVGQLGTMEQTKLNALLGQQETNILAWKGMRRRSNGSGTSTSQQSHLILWLSKHGQQTRPGVFSHQSLCYSKADFVTGLHDWLLAMWGCPIGELWDLEKLAERCKVYKRWSFFLASVPLNVVGGVASPPNAVAIL